MQTIDTLVRSVQIIAVIYRGFTGNIRRGWILFHEDTQEQGTGETSGLQPV